MNKLITNARRPWTRIAVTLVATGALAFGIAACGDDDDADEATAESSGDAGLTIYSGRSEDFMGALLDRFSEEAGVEVEVRYGDSAELAAAILEEGENSPADVFLSQDAGALGALEDEGLLSPLDKATLNQVEPAFRSTRGGWVGTTGRARTVAYDGDELDESDLPESVLDLTDPEWEGRIGWAPTNASFQAFVTGMRLTEGDDVTRKWLEDMVANDTVTYGDNISVRDAIAAGEIDAGLINHYYVAEAIEEEGEDYPVKLFFPPNGDIGSLINVAGAGVLTGADGAETGAELIDFMLSKPEQQYFTDEIKEYPLVKGVDPDPGLVPLAQIDQPDVDLADLADLAATLTLIEESGAL